MPRSYQTGDTLKQLLARSLYLLFNHDSKWTDSEKYRAGLLFDGFPEINDACNPYVRMGDIFQKATSKEVAFKGLSLWYNEVESSGLESFRTVARYIQNTYLNILNFFNNRSTNASAESFNAKVKSFRASSRCVRDVNFFLFRLANIYA